MVGDWGWGVIYTSSNVVLAQVHSIEGFKNYQPLREEALEHLHGVLRRGWANAKCEASLVLDELG